jgi:ATP-dependent DNA helicase RecG
VDVPSAKSVRRAPIAPDVPASAVPLTALAGVGPLRARKLEALGLRSVHDLLCTPPRRLDTSPALVPIATAKSELGLVRRIRGKVASFRFSRFGRRTLVRVAIEDASGSVDALFFNQPWLRERFRRGDEVELIGRAVTASGTALVVLKLGSEQSPLPREDALEPIYPSTEGVTQEWLRGLIERALAEHGQRVSERLDRERLRACDLPELPQAIREVHAPSSPANFERARRRIALEPLVALQASLLARRRERASGRALVAQIGEREQRELLARFPFALTHGQLRAIEDLRADLARAAPMRRLLQGDVGSGKTALGVYACMLIAAAGGQAAFLAPTELLAEQHRRGMLALLERAGLRSALLVGALGARERRQILAGLAAGEIDLVFGTHALLEPDVRFRRLALAVIDEQHRFGVAQRERVFDKGPDVHGLLMTATPIPRSLALTIYGDLDVSVLRERPPGRQPIVTRWLREPKELAHELGARLERGELVYWVVPRIDGEDEDALGAEQRYERLRTQTLARHGLELVHGRMPSAERNARLARFHSGEARLLVATTVIEVGVDEPRATAIVIEAAERLGLAQLHQLRGRVGRGTNASSCYLLGKQSAGERFEVLERTNDGFAIAEEDLRRRGMGDLVGARQAGDNREGLANDESDLELILLARELAAQGAIEQRAAPFTQ